MFIFTKKLKSFEFDIEILFFKSFSDILYTRVIMYYNALLFKSLSPETDKNSRISILQKIRF